MKKLGIKEELELEIANIKIGKIEEGKEFKREDLIGLANIGASMENYDIPAEGEYKDYFFEIDENYKVTVLDKLRGEKPTIDANIISTSSKTTVEIEVTASITEGTIKSIEATNGATLKEGAENTNTKKIFTVNKNGTYLFKAKADNGRSAVKIVTVNTLMDAPKISAKNIKAFEFTITIDNNYEEGVITEYKYYVNGNVVNEGTINKEYTVNELEHQTEYTIYVEAYITDSSTPIVSDTVKIKTKNAEEFVVDLDQIEFGTKEMEVKNLEDGKLQFITGGGWKGRNVVFDNVEITQYSKIVIEYHAYNYGKIRNEIYRSRSTRR